MRNSECRENSTIIIRIYQLFVFFIDMETSFDDVSVLTSRADIERALVAMNERSATVDASLDALLATRPELVAKANSLTGLVYVETGDAGAQGLRRYCCLSRFSSFADD